MRTCLLWVLVGLAAAAVPLSAQTVEFDRIVPPASATPRTFEDFLVQQAYLNNVGNAALQAEVAVADLEIRRAKLGWLEQVNGNVNFSSLQDSVYGRFGLGSAPNPDAGIAGDPRFVRPGFNYGLSFNVGGIVNNRKRVRIAEQKKLVAEARRDQEKLALRGLVLSRLERFDNARDVLRIRRLGEIDAETNYTLVRSLFEQGKAQFEDLAQASEVYHRAVEAVAVAESQVQLARIGLEEAVGAPWDRLRAVRERMGGG